MTYLKLCCFDAGHRLLRWPHIKTTMVKRPLLAGWALEHNTKHLYNVGPTSSTLVQHCTNVIQIFCVCWDIMSTNKFIWLIFLLFCRRHSRAGITWYPVWQGLPGVAGHRGRVAGQLLDVRQRLHGHGHDHDTHHYQHHEDSVLRGRAVDVQAAPDWHSTLCQRGGKEGREDVIVWRHLGYMINNCEVCSNANSSNCLLGK